MANEQYLIVSYFVIAGICVCLCIGTYLVLHRSFEALTAHTPGGRLGTILRRLFLLGIVLPAMAGFFSVSFRSCEKQEYRDIIADKSYILAKNQEQIGNSLSYVAIALLMWGLIIAVSFMVRNKKKIGI